MHSEMFCTRRDCVLGKPDAASDGVAVDQERTGWPHPLHGIQHALRDVLQSRGGSAPAFASLSAAQRFPGALAQERHATKEINAGGTVFPLSYCHLSDKECPGLVGTGYVSLIHRHIYEPKNASTVVMPVVEQVVWGSVILLCIC
jgi:hypothetical protein